MTGIIILILFVALILFLVLLVRANRQKHIVKFDNAGLTTRAGKNYLWADLRSINYMTAVKQYDKKAPEKVRSIEFAFADGKAIAGYLMPLIDPLLKKAAALDVKKTKKMVGYYQR